MISSVIPVNKSSLVESITNEDFDSFSKLFENILKNEYQKQVEARLNDFKGVKNER